MATARIWPAKGARAYDEDGGIIPPSGLTVTLTPHYYKLLSRGLVLTRDPYELSAVMAGGSWFEASKCNVSGGKVASFVDLLDSTHLLEQSTAANRVNAPDDDNNLNGAESVTFTGAEWYASNRAASAWRHLHDGTGCDAIIVFVVTTTATGTYTFLSTCDQDSFSTQRGAWWGLTVPGYQRQSMRISNATATRVVNSTDKTFGGVVGTPHWARMSYEEGSSPEYLHAIERVVLDYGDSGAAPASGDPQTTLILGGDNGGAELRAQYRWHSLFLSAPGTRFTDADVQKIATYIEDQTGIAKPQSAVAAGKRRALVLAFGESMVVGQASTVNLPVGYPPVNGKVKRFDDSEHWLEMAEPSDNPGTATLHAPISDPLGAYGVGYVSMFCAELQQLLGDEYEVGLVTCGLSGTRSWDWAVGGDKQLSAVAKVKAALALPGSELCCAVLDQGVNDCTAANDPDGKTWTNRHDEFFAALEAEVPKFTEDIPLIYRQLALTIPGVYIIAKWDALKLEEAAWENLEGPGRKRVMMTGVDGPYVGGGPHYNTPGNIAQAALLLDAYKAFPGPQGNGPEPPVLTGYRGLGGWDTSTVFGTDSGEGVAGSASTGLCVLLLVRMESLPGTLQRLCERVLGSAGYNLRTNGATLQLIVGNGATSVTAPSRIWTSADVGKLHLIALSDDLTTVRAYVDNTEIGSGIPLAGYAAAARSMVLGSSDGGSNPATSFTILGCAGRDSPLTLAEFLTISAATKEANVLALGGVSMDHMWSVPLVDEVPDTIEDSIGAHDMSFQQGVPGNLTLVSFEADDIVWGW